MKRRLQWQQKTVFRDAYNQLRGNNPNAFVQDYTNYELAQGRQIPDFNKMFAQPQFRHWSYRWSDRMKAAASMAIDRTKEAVQEVLGGLDGLSGALIWR